jgi:hypothetical protein
MWLFFLQETTDEFATGGVRIDNDASKGIIASLASAMKKGFDPTEQFQILSEMENKVMDLQKTMGSGLVLGGEAFRAKVEEIYFETTELGVQFKDVTDLMGGMSKSVGRIIDPSKDVVKEMAILGKNVGIASEAMGTLVGDFMNLTFSQEKSADLINKITDLARKGGVNVKNTLEAVQKNLDKVSAYGFKNGIDGLTKMTVQAQQLRTSVEEIGAVQMGQTFWDPEKAIEAAAGMSMLGGSMSNLMNPFQLMNMGANNVEKLQESLIDLSASAYKVNETTGEVETNFVAQQRLKQQLEALGKGGEYEKFINLGREAAKQAKIIADINKSGLGELFAAEGGTFTEEDQRLIASLSEVKDGKISLKIPGFDQIDNLQDALTGNPDRIKEALKTYQEQTAMSEKEIAQKSLSTVDNIKYDTTIISQTLLRSLSASERTAVLLTAGGAAKEQVDKTQQVTSAAAVGGKDLILNPDTWKKIFTDNPPTPSSDRFFGEGNKTLSLGKGQMFEFIQEDQAIFAPDLDEKLGILKEAYLQLKKLSPVLQTEMAVKTEGFKMPEMKLPDFSMFEKLAATFSEKTQGETKKETKKETVQKIEGSGTININVNISSSGDLASSLMSDRRFKNDLETEILNTMKNKDLLMVQKP